MATAARLIGNEGDVSTRPGARRELGWSAVGPQEQDVIDLQLTNAVRELRDKGLVGARAWRAATRQVAQERIGSEGNPSEALQLARNEVTARRLREQMSEPGYVANHGATQGEVDQLANMAHLRNERVIEMPKQNVSGDNIERTNDATIAAFAKHYGMTEEKVRADLREQSQFISEEETESVKDARLELADQFTAYADENHRPRSSAEEAMARSAAAQLRAGKSEIDLTTTYATSFNGQAVHTHDRALTNLKAFTDEAERLGITVNPGTAKLSEGFRQEEVLAVAERMAL